MDKEDKPKFLTGLKINNIFFQYKLLGKEATDRTFININLIYMR